MKPIHFLNLVLGALLVASLAACGHIRKPEQPVSVCAGIDWWEAGRTDGVAGHAVFKLDDYKKRCQGTDVAVDEQLYINGRDAGLIDYCTPAQGFAAGHSGAIYENVCPIHLEPAFLRAFQTGARLGALESEDVDLEARIENLRRLLETQQAGSAVRSQLEQLRGQRAELVSEISKIERTSSLQ